MSVLEQAGRVRVADMRAAAAATVEELAHEIARMREALERTEERQRVAERELVYWINVREPDEILRECGLEGPVETIGFGIDFVRDGVKLRRCNQTHPCPDHGRPLGGSDWRLHPVNPEVRGGHDIMHGPLSVTIEGRAEMRERVEVTDSNARSTVHGSPREGGVERDGVVYDTPGDLPRLNTCPVHQAPVLPGELCPHCRDDGERVATEYPLGRPGL